MAKNIPYNNGGKARRFDNKLDFVIIEDIRLPPYIHMI